MTVSDPRVFDGHVHVYPTPSEQWPLFHSHEVNELPLPRFDHLDLQAFMAAAGVRRANLVQKRQWGLNDGGPHDYLSHVLARANLGRLNDPVFIGTGVVDVGNPGLESLLAKLKAAGFRALRIYPRLTEADPKNWLDTKDYNTFFELCAKLQLVVSCMVAPESLPEVLRMSIAHPKTQVVIDHMGLVARAEDDSGERLGKLFELSSQPNVFVKLSGFYNQGKRTPPYEDLQPLARAILTTFGSRHCLWGSDGPYQMVYPHSYEASLEFARSLPELNDEDRQNLLWNTANRLYSVEHST